MKIFKENRLTSALHAFWGNKIKNALGIDSRFLSLIHYVESIPKKFYSKLAYKTYLEFLQEAARSDGALLVDVLREFEHVINSSNQILNEIAQKKIHDIILPEDKNDVIDFLDKEIHFNLLKLYETPFHSFLVVVAKINRIKKNKGTDGLDIHNVVDDLKNGIFSFVDAVYRSTVRNGIAHGKVVFTEYEVIYSDKKGNQDRLSHREIIRLFDNLLDITNAFSLAFKAFLFANPMLRSNLGIGIHRSILIEELKTICELPGWKILNCFESLALGNRSQLTIYVQNANWDYNKVQLFSFSTAFWAEYLTQEFDRIFISLHSIHALPGWAAFDSKKLRQLRVQKVETLESYKDVLENNMIFFIPRMKFPRLIYKLGTMRSALKISWFLFQKKQQEQKLPFAVRDSLLHSKGKFLVVQDASVVLLNIPTNDVTRFIETNYRNIIKDVTRYSTRQIGLFSLKRFLSFKYMRIFIYDTDLRVRDLRFSGLIPQLVATIDINKTKNIKTIDILNGRAQQMGNHRIVWYKMAGHKR